MRAIWCDENLVRTWLDVERAIARALDEEGHLEPGALAAIEAAAVVENVPMDVFRRRTRVVGMPVKPLVEAIAAAGGELVAKYFHWGATTQDILDSAQALRVKASLAEVRRQVVALLGELVAMADAHRATAMVARTNSQDASVTSWGLQVAGVAAELVRHLERLGPAERRATMGMFGGAVGTLAVFGERGVAIRDRVIELLGLEPAVGAWNGSQDGVAEIVQLDALLLGTLVRFANDVEMLGRNAVRELLQRGPRGSSSTMPHKGNPRDANMVQTLFELGAMHAGQAVRMMDQVDVRSASMRMLSWTLVPESFLVTSAALDRSLNMARTLVVDAERMRENFAQSRGFVMSEAVMFALAEHIGRLPAYEAVAAALAADDGVSTMVELLARAPAVSAHLTRAEIEAAARPEAYLGAAGALIDEVIAAARPWLLGAE
ncbi:MAG: adenylosuccinate lyase family protein [Deltaproteobacteria bacterium]|nr:adenylosuccinate lyase family protein [Deltaproteobacteria bacterium]